MLASTSSPARVRSRSGSLRASLRVPTKFIPFASTGPLTKQSRPLAVPSSPADDRLSFCEEDLVDIAPEELTLASRDPQLLVEDWDPLVSSQPLLVRSRRSLSRFSSFRRPSRSATFRFASSERAEAPAENVLEPILDPGAQAVSSFRPSRAAAKPPATRSVSIDEPAFGFYGDPFQKADAHTESEYYSPPKLIPVSPLRVVEEVLDPNCIAPSPPITRVSSASTLTPSNAVSAVALSPLRKTLQRLKSLRLTRVVPYHNRAPEVLQMFPGGEGALASTAPAHAQGFLPELSFDSTPLSDLISAIHVSADALSYQGESGISQPPLLPVPPPTAQPEATALREQSLQVVKYQRVDPKDLTPSPYTVAASDISPAANLITSIAISSADSQ
ncbi:hypothetical protein BC835DRAFT_1402448 [Cytidiella melzeri]|nr:hypothetical protein BC835DRAFT_1402448 [Cytidiella melzeri]